MGFIFLILPDCNSRIRHRVIIVYKIDKLSKNHSYNLYKCINHSKPILFDALKYHDRDSGDVLNSAFIKFSIIWDDLIIDFIALYSTTIPAKTIHTTFIGGYKVGTKKGFSGSRTRHYF